LSRDFSDYKQMADEIQFMHEELTNLSNEIQAGIDELKKNAKRFSPDVRNEKVGRTQYIVEIVSSHYNRTHPVLICSVVEGCVLARQNQSFQRRPCKFQR
jgi:hypothetical protein